MGKEIVLDLMYNGRYLKQENNIGFEIINLFKADSGEFYLYLQPYGTFAKEHKGKIETMLLVRKVDGMPLLEVLGKGIGLIEIYDPSQPSLSQEEFKNICYGGVKLKDIFRECQYQDIFVTFKARKTLRAAKKIYIGYELEKKENDKYDEYNPIWLKGVGLPKQAQKQYFNNKEDKLNYDILEELIKNKENWCTQTVEKLVVKRSDDIELYQNFFDICGIADRELAFSNALAYLISTYPELLVRFVKEQYNLSIELFDDKSLEIVRESECNIDLLIKCKSHVLVIENKIRSGINGIDERENKAYNQLIKYYDYVIDTYKKNEHPRICKFCVLKPDYSRIDLAQYLESKSEAKDAYKEIVYSDVLSFLLKYKEKVPYKSDNFFQEFLFAIKRHSQSHYDDQFEIMKKKFKRIIKKRKEEVLVI